MDGGFGDNCDCLIRRATQAPLVEAVPPPADHALEVPAGQRNPLSAVTVVPAGGQRGGR